MKTLSGDLVGLLVLAALLVLVHHLWPPMDALTALFAFILFGAPMVGLWHLDKPHLVRRSECLFMMGLSIATGAVAYGFYRFGINVFNYDIYLLGWFPGFALMAIASLARIAVLGRRTSTGASDY